jgi:hypothetical protein
MALSDEDRRRIEKEEANRLALKIDGFTESYATMRMHTKDVVWTPDNEEQAQYRKLTFERLEREEPTRVREGWEVVQAQERRSRESYKRALEDAEMNAPALAAYRARASKSLDREAYFGFGFPILVCVICFVLQKCGVLL